MSVIAKWYLKVIVPMLWNTKEPNGLGRLQVGAGTGVMWELPGGEPAADASGVGEEQERGGTAGSPQLQDNVFGQSGR